MKLILGEPKYFKDSISIISELVTEGTFKVTKNGIELVAMDPANVAMVIFKLLSSAFSEYKVEKEVELKINLINLKQIMRRAGANDILTMELDSDSRFKLQLKGKSTRTFSLPLIDIEDTEQKIPDLKFPVVIETQCSFLNDAIEDADIISDSLSFLVEDKNFVVKAEGDMNKAKIEIPEDDDTKLKVDGKGPFKAKYSNDYLKKMSQASKLTNTVKVQFNTDYPLKLEYVNVDKVQMVFILAPRVESD